MALPFLCTFQTIIANPKCIGILNHLFSARSYTAELASASIVGEFRENPDVAWVGDGRLSLTEFGARFEPVQSYSTP